MRFLLGGLTVLLLLLQYRLWLGDVGVLASRELKAEYDHRAGKLALLEARNERLRNEVVHLKADDAALEGIARLDLGMVKAGETFYFVPDSVLAERP